MHGMPGSPGAPGRDRRDWAKGDQGSPGKTGPQGSAGAERKKGDKGEFGAQTPPAKKDSEGRKVRVELQDCFNFALTWTGKNAPGKGGQQRLGYDTSKWFTVRALK